MRRIVQCACGTCSFSGSFLSCLFRIFLHFLAFLLVSRYNFPAPVMLSFFICRPILRLLHVFHISSPIYLYLPFVPLHLLIYPSFLIDVGLLSMVLAFGSASLSMQIQCSLARERTSNRCACVCATDQRMDRDPRSRSSFSHHDSGACFTASARARAPRGLIAPPSANRRGDHVHDRPELLHLDIVPTGTLSILRKST
ncbi:hypothetical protein B0H12DRAFT_326318 [Mycena haematopus]|nr:hypothetical protein B0H12DRAFT_326318 [Mycena haematopus]